MADPNSIMIDVRNFNESLIGKFAPPPPAEGVEKVWDEEEGPRPMLMHEGMPRCCCSTLILTPPLPFPPGAGPLHAPLY